MAVNGTAHLRMPEGDERRGLAIDFGLCSTDGGGAEERTADDGRGRGEEALDLVLVESVVRHFTGNSPEDWSSGLEALTRAVGGRSAVLGAEGADEVPLALASYGPVDAVTRDREVVRQVRRAREEATGCTVHAFRSPTEPRVDFAMVVTPRGGLLGLALWGAARPPEVVHPLIRTAVWLLHRLRVATIPPAAAPGGGKDSAGTELCFPPGYVVGTSAAMADVHRELAAVSLSDLSVLLCGETGTGKELLARTVHLSSARADRPFVAINCAAIPDTLLEAELFGVERRVATGVDPRDGRFEQADGGTLFLDEIGEMPPALQVKLLRVLQEREVQPLGGRSRAIDVRVVAATNSDLGRAMTEGIFRRDLYYRLAGIEVWVPPLRSRREDVAILVRHFLDRSLAEAGKGIRGVSLRAMEALVEYGWPGNVRELEHEIRRLVFVSPEGCVIESCHLRDSFLHKAVEPPGSLGRQLESGRFDLKEYLDGIERGILHEALARAGGNQTRAAELLSLSRNGLAKKVQRFGIDPSEVVKG